MTHFAFETPEEGTGDGAVNGKFFHSLGHGPARGQSIWEKGGVAGAQGVDFAALILFFDHHLALQDLDNFIQAKHPFEAARMALPDSAGKCSVRSNRQGGGPGNRVAFQNPVGIDGRRLEILLMDGARLNQGKVLGVRLTGWAVALSLNPKGE